jgi:translation initiation factor IF-2
VAKKRIYDIAKDFEVSSEALVGVLRSLKFEVKNHMSFATDEMIAALEKKFEEEKTAVKEEYARKKSQKSKQAAKAPAAKAPPAKAPAAKAPAAKKAAAPAKAKKGREKRKKPDIKAVKESVKKTLAQIDRGHKAKPRRRRSLAGEVVEEERRLIRVSEFISVAELADLISVPANQLITKCMGLGLMVTLNHRLSFDEVTMIADEYEYEAEQLPEYGQELLQELEGEDQEADLISRPPVVTIMGHVDHGKTLLLDYIRKSNVVAGEYGGITQHIGAYEVSLEGGQITFLDTPGHEAFTAMRARGAGATDLVVLVVAADDGVKPQTVEAIDHAKAAGVPIIVAINKMDRPAADPDRVRKQLSDHKLVDEAWGGDVITVECSAKTGEGIAQLLEMILLQAEVLELKANPKKTTTGVVLISTLDKGKGSVVTILVQEGTLEVGAPFITGRFSGKVRAMLNERGGYIDSAGPSTPVQVLGSGGLPDEGDGFQVVPDERMARQISQKRQESKRLQEQRVVRRASLAKLFDDLKEGKVNELNLILKADVVGSADALADSLSKLAFEEVKINIVRKAVGAVSESDVLLAATTDSIIIGFHVRPTPGAWELGKRENVDIRLYNVIFEIVDDITKALEGILPQEEKETVVGTAEVLQVFRVPRQGAIAGCNVRTGLIRRNARVRVIRNDDVIHAGQVGSLKRFKDDVKEVNAGFECGIGIDGFDDFQEKDILEAFDVEMVAKKLT